MEHNTVGKIYDAGKVVSVECKKNPPLGQIDTNGSYFLLIALFDGNMLFSVDGEEISASAPCFICFNELQEAFLVSQNSADYYCIYFHPHYLNLHMSFELLRSQSYSEIAHIHDMFLLKPFIDGASVVPICENYVRPVQSACDSMKNELFEQRDWYWSCRGRSYFMEIIIALERMYSLAGLGRPCKAAVPTSKNASAKLHSAVLYIESHFAQNITLADICKSAHLNHTTLTSLFKKEYGKTAIEYLTDYRIDVARRQVGFTNIPFKDIATRCGFKTVQHFSRIFKEKTGLPPASYRVASRDGRDAEFFKN
ncbi:MAG: helix-turn-helix transcriptional regulator [Candidatus Avispirillum sp.]